MEADIKLCEELLAMDTFQDAKGDRRSYGENAADAAAAAHPAWAAKRKAANEAWGSVKPEGKKIKFT